MNINPTACKYLAGPSCDSDDRESRGDMYQPRFAVVAVAGRGWKELGRIELPNSVIRPDR